MKRKSKMKTSSTSTPSWILENSAQVDSSGDAADLSRRLGIPELFRSASLSHFHRENFRSGHWVLDPEARKGRRDVLVVGPNGVGKTHLAVALAREWKARFVRVPDLLTRVRRTFKAHVEESEHSILDELVQAPALALDDLTSTTLREFGLALVLSLVNRRIEDCRSTIVTSHHKLAAIDALDSALASRLGGFERIELMGPDRRLARK